ncbi:hypothetical protein Tco_1458338 [Tanacetum coccineum]
MLVIQAEEGEGLGHPSEPQPPPSTAQPTNEEPIPNTSEPIPNVADEAVYEEWDDRVKRATTSATSLDAGQASGGSPRCQEAIGGSIAQTRSERVPRQSYDSPLPRVHTLGSDEGSMTLLELTVLCTTLSKKVESLEADLKQTKKVYGAAYTKLIKKVKKLEKTVKSNQARRREKIMVLDNEEDLEDSSKQERMIEEIDQDKKWAVSSDSGGISTTEESVSTAGASMLVSTAGMVQEVNIIIPSPVIVKDKGKGKQSKRTKLQQEQERLGYEAAVRLQEELNEEERQRMAKVHEASQSFTEEEWENIRARVEADEELSKRLQSEERNKYKIAARSSQETITDSAEVGSSKRAAEVELDHEGSKKQKTNEALGSVQEQPKEEEKELSQEDLQQVMMIVSVEEVYVEALHVKYPIIDWEVHTEKSRKYWKIIRVGNHTEAYQFFEDMLKIFDRDDLVELKRLFEPNTNDELWKLQRERDRYFHAGRERISIVKRSSDCDVRQQAKSGSTFRDGK